MTVGDEGDHHCNVLPGQEGIVDYMEGHPLPGPKPPAVRMWGKVGPAYMINENTQFK